MSPNSRTVPHRAPVVAGASRPAGVAAPEDSRAAASSRRASASGRAIASSSSSQIQSWPAAKACVMPSAKPPAPPRLTLERSSVTPSAPPGPIAPAASLPGSLALSTT